MKSIKFSEIRDDLENILREKLDKVPIPGENKFALIEGFMTLPFRTDLNDDLTIGGPQIPIVGIVGMTSGQIYIFALKLLLPHLKI